MDDGGSVAALVGLAVARRASEGQFCAGILGVGGSGKTRALTLLSAECRNVGRDVVAGWPPPTERPDSVLLIDDAHRLGDDELQALNRLVRDAERSVIVTLRPAMKRPLVGELVVALSDHHPLARLRPLDAAELGQAAATSLGAPAASSLVDLIAEVTGGNALVASRLLEGWRHAGLVAQGRLKNNADPPLDPSSLLDALAGRLAQLTPGAQELLASIALLPTEQAFHLMTRRQPTEFAELLDAGLVLPDRVSAAVAACVPRLSDATATTAAHVSVAATLAELEAPAIDVAAHLWSVRSNTPTAVTAFVRAGAETLTSEPASSLTWFRRAIAIDPDRLDALSGLAHAATQLGRVDEALDAASALGRGQPANGVASAIAGAAYASRGLWSEAGAALTLAAAADHPLADFWRSQAHLCAVLAGAHDLAPQSPPSSLDLPATMSTLVAQAFRLSVGSSPSDISLARARLQEAAALGDLVQMPVITAVAPAEVAVAVACALGDLPLAARLARMVPGRGLRELSAARCTSWIAVRRGESAVALPTQVDDLVGLALLAAQSRRSGDVAEGAAIARRLAMTLAATRIDPLNLDAAGELLVLARRFGPTVVADDIERRITSTLEALGGSPLWAVRFHWSQLEAAVHTRHADAAISLAARLSNAGQLAPHLEPLAEAASVWAELIGGSVDHDRVEGAVAALSDLGLGWEAANLAGQAAIRADNADSAKTLLGRARVLRAGATPAPPSRADVDRPVTRAGLSVREVEVGRLVLDGLTHKDIGSTLFISPKTVEHHVAHIRQKLSASTRAEMLAALRLDLTTDIESQN